MARRQLVLDALNNRPTERPPVGFWFHFAAGDEFTQGLTDPAVIRKNIDGHKRFFASFQPDLIKLMSDGFFAYPNPALAQARQASDLRALEPIGANHPWITAQVELVRELTGAFGAEVLTFYNIFAPVTFFKLLCRSAGNSLLARFIAEDPQAVKHALDVIAADISTLARRVITEGKADGIYLSVQNVQDTSVTSSIYQDVIAPSELRVLQSANAASEINILHICGYEGSRNDLALYVSYPAKAINWAVTIEKVSLKEGRKLFGGRAVIGGFDNRAAGLLAGGSREAIEAFTTQLLQETGRTGIILGADCTVPHDIDLNRLQWVRDTAARFQSYEGEK